MSLPELLSQQGFVVLDGGFGTQLEALGADLHDPLWSAKVLLEAPEMLEQVNYAYLSAGADIATTASYQATIPGLMAKGLTAAQAESVLRQSVEIARQARDRFWSHETSRLKPLVVASVGPYGAYLHDGSEYRGNYGLTHDQLKDFHRARLAILVDAKPELIAFETFPSQLEAEAIVDLLAEFPNAACWISFSEATPLGVAVRAVCQSPQVLAVGVNCVAPSHVEALLHEAKQETDKPLVAYPNGIAGFDAASARTWYNAGARLIGGCCNTTPDTIRAIRSALMAM